MPFAKPMHLKCAKWNVEHFNTLIMQHFGFLTALVWICKIKLETLSKVPLLVALWMYDYNGCTPEVQASNLTMRAFYTIVY